MPGVLTKIVIGKQRLNGVFDAEQIRREKFVKEQRWRKIL